MAETELKALGLISVVLLLFLALPALAQSNVCNALRAAAPVGKEIFVRPTAAMDREILEHFLSGGSSANYRAAAMKALALTDGESADLAKNATGHTFEAFKPDCDWTQDAPDSLRPSSAVPTFTFTSPLFSTNGNLTVIVRSRFIGGTGSSGSLCALRRKGDVWIAACFNTWIS